MASRPIAVFDSGLGGISVLRHLLRLLPNEDYLYFGDNKNAPYGTKSREQVQTLTLAAAEHLLSFHPKALVIACNTATSAAIGLLREKYPDEIIIGIEPALKPAIEANPDGVIGVMATPLTLKEEKFQRLSAQYPGMQVVSIPAPGLVERIEAGEDPDKMEAFLKDLLAQYPKMDAIVLGCTHYPFVGELLAKITGATVLDGGEGTARHTARRLIDAGLAGGGTGKVTWQFSAGDGQSSRAKELL